MFKRIAAITFIFLCTAFAWGILGATIFQRTYDSDSSSANRVVSTWGAPQSQLPPTASFEEFVPRKEVKTENGKKIETLTQDLVITQLPLESSHLNVALNLEHRQKGLLWYSTYKVGFAGAYAFRNSTDKEQSVIFTLPFPTTQAIYDNLVFTVDGVPVPLKNEQNAATGSVKIGAGKVATLKVGYNSQGLNDWRYSFVHANASNGVAQVRDFSLKMTTNFKEIDFPDNTLSPSQKEETADGWNLTWNYTNLVSGYQIAMVMPEKLQPGPLAGRISFFAPVSLFFFFFLLLIITTLRGIELHPMNYFFLATAFFSFHLLLAYPDGSASRVAESLQLDRNNEWLVGAEEVFQGMPLEGQPALHVFVEPQLAPGYIAWVVHDGHEIHLGVGGYANRFDPALSLNTFRQSLAEKFDFHRARLVERRGGRIPVNGILRRLANERGLLVGDAAGAVSPLTAGGFDGCLRLSTLAAEVIQQFLTSGDPHVLQTYSGESFRSRFVSRLWMRRIASQVTQPALIEFACAVLRLPLLKSFTWHVFFGRGSFPDVQSVPQRMMPRLASLERS